MTRIHQNNTETQREKADVKSKIEFNDELIRELESSEYWSPKTTSSSNFISALICPECGECEAWAHSDFPHTIYCNRKNKCGAATKTLSLFPHLARGFKERFPQQQKIRIVQ